MSGARPDLEAAIVRTVAYADVFDHALRLDELRRYLALKPAPAAEAVDEALQRSPLRDLLVFDAGYVYLGGRAGIVERRRRRVLRSRRLWRQVTALQRVLRRVPFADMVAVTGSLALDNAREGDDVDLFVLCRRDRVWTCRAALALLTRIVRPLGVRLCPNYVIALDEAAAFQRELYVAREICQMVPIVGLRAYRRLRSLVSWTDDLLPAAREAPRRPAAPRPVAPRPGLLTRLLAGRVGDRVERWERRRKIAKMQRLEAGHPEVAAGPQVYKGHTRGHGLRIARAYRQRLDGLARAAPHDFAPLLSHPHPEVDPCVS